MHFTYINIIIRNFNYSYLYYYDDDHIGYNIYMCV